MSGLAGQAIGLDEQSPTPIGGPAALDAESKGSMENFIGFGLGATSYDPAPVDFDAADDTVTSAADGTTRVAPEYTDSQLSWGGSVPTFLPSDLYREGDTCPWYNFGNLSTLFQDAEGEIPVTTVGQSVALAKDQSGNGIDLALTNVTLGLADGIYGLVFAPGGAAAGQTATLDISSDKVTFAVTAEIATGVTATFASNGDFISLNGRFDFQNTTFYWHGDGAGWGGHGTEPKRDEPYLTTGILDLEGTTQATENPLFAIDGTQGTLTNYGTADTGDGNFASAPLKVGQGYTAFVGMMFQLFLINRVLVQDELDALNYYLLDNINKAPLVPYTEPFVWHDSEALIDKGDYQQTSAYAFVEFQTSAKRISVTGYSNIFDAFPLYSSLGVFVNGVFHDNVQIGVMGSATQEVLLPAGAKTIRIENGLQSALTNNIDAISGTFLTELASDSPLTPVAPSAVNRLVVYGDSIDVGANATVPLSEGAINLLRADRSPKSTVFLAFGYRNLVMDCGNSTKRAAFVAKVVALNPAVFYSDIGNNDWAMTTDSVPNFTTIYGAMLDDLHAALPSMAIYCQTMITHVPESATNGNGYVIQDFRDGIISACSTRPWATLIDGEAFVTPANIPDGTHPNTAGHAELFSHVSAIVG